MHVHLVFMTKYRRHVLNGNMIDYLAGVFRAVCEDFEARLVECNGEDDHMHLLIEYPPKIQVSHLVNSLKGVSARMLGNSASGPIATTYGAPATSQQAAAARRRRSSTSTSRIGGDRNRLTQPP